MAVITYKCPNCGGDLRFAPSGQQYQCEFCDSKFTQQQLDELAVEEEARKIFQEEGQSAEGEGYGAGSQAGERGQDALCYNCPSCGAQIVTDGTTAATICYYCHNPVVLAGRMEGSYRPDCIIPFAVDKKKALEIFGQWIKKKKYVPEDFYSKSQIDSMTGVYFPYWLYGCQVEGKLDAQATRLTSWVAGDLRYTRTEQYDVSRQGDVEVKHVPRNALSKANRQLVEGVFPFEMDKKQPFHMGYLSGFLAENRDMDQQQFRQEVEDEVKEYAQQSLRDGISGYNSLQIRSQQSSISNASWTYALLPVWTLTYKDKRDGKIYYFACNGQTGKVCGQLPIDNGRLRGLFLKLFVPVAAVLLAVGYFLG